MLPITFLLALTVATTTLAANLTAPETICNAFHSRVPTAASCDVALNKIQSLLIPYYRREPIKVGASRTSDIRLWKAFADDRPGLPPETLRCSILLVWDPEYEKAQQPHPVSPNAWDELYPNQLQSAAQRIRDQCIAGPVPQFGNEHIIPHQWVFVIFEAFVMDSASGNWTMLAANGTNIAVDASIVNPVVSSASSASTVLGTGLGSDSVQTS